jgi:hypothetical protein
MNNRIVTILAVSLGIALLIILLQALYINGFRVFNPVNFVLE